MKKEIKKLFEGKPSPFFDAVRTQLDEKVETVIPFVAEELAETVFIEGFKQDWQDLTNWRGSQNYALGQKVASLPKEKKKGLFDRFKKKDKKEEK